MSVVCLVHYNVFSTYTIFDISVYQNRKHLSNILIHFRLVILLSLSCEIILIFQFTLQQHCNWCRKSWKKNMKQNMSRGRPSEILHCSIDLFYNCLFLLYYLINYIQNNFVQSMFLFIMFWLNGVFCFLIACYIIYMNPFETFFL